MEQLIGCFFVIGEIMFYLVTSWEVVSLTVVLFEFREGLTYHDGILFNVELVVVVLNFVYDFVNVFDLFDIMGFRIGEVVGEYMLKVMILEGDFFGFQKIEFMFFMLVKQIQVGKYFEVFIGIGFYLFIEWRQGEGLFYEVNFDWWGINNFQDGGGVIFFEKVSYRIVFEVEVCMVVVLVNEIHVVQFMIFEQCKSFGMRSGVSCQLAVTVETIFLCLDGVSFLMRDVRVRQVFLLVIDQETIVSIILGGVVFLVGQIVNQMVLGYNLNLVPYLFDFDYARFFFNEVKVDGVFVDELIRYYVYVDVWFFGVELVMIVVNMFCDVGFIIVDQFYVGMEMDDFFVIYWDGCNEIVCPNVGTTVVEFDNRNVIMMYQYGNEILDFVYLYGLYFVCGVVVVVGCYLDNDVFW